MGNQTKTGYPIFGKNSDRDPDEAQNVKFFAGKEHDLENIFEKEVQCTHIAIPQVAETYDIVLSQPFWMWGGEMGVNQWGVAIGNEAVFTNQPLEKKEDGLTGMDMIRLGLERKKNAKEAMYLIIRLLEKYGQGGACGYTHKEMSYHNSWIIADPNEAFVLESAGKHWVYKKVKKRYSISNVLTIGKSFDGISNGTVEFAIKEAKCDSRGQFSFKNSFSPRINTKQGILNWGAHGKDRRNAQKIKINRRIKKTVSNFSQIDAMRILRSHQKTKKQYNPSHGSAKDVCWHAHGLFSPSQSVNSMVAQLRDDWSTIWTTIGSSPCIQTYKPIVIFRKYPNHLPNLIKQTHAQTEYNPNALWWRNEAFHRLVIKDYPNRIMVFKEERHKLEVQTWHNLNRLMDKFDLVRDERERMNKQIGQFCNISFNHVETKMREWSLKMEDINTHTREKRHYKHFWNRLDEKNGLKIYSE